MLRASVTPLASIFGSGFLIIVPLLERTMGRYAVVGVLAVTGIAWFIGSAIRRNIRVLEPRIEKGGLSETDRRLEQLSDVLIAVAYVISVALYLRIMAEYVVRYVSPGADVTSLIASASVAVIVSVGIMRGFGGLDVMQRFALVAVLIAVTILGVAFAGNDVANLFSGGLDLPPGGNASTMQTLLVLGGLVITVQGFETVRYLGDEFDADTRIQASRISQAVAASIYIGFVVVATPLMGIGSDAGPDGTLLDITERLAPLLGLPLVICAVLSQFSAATADTAAAAGNLHHLNDSLSGRVAYVVTGLAAGVMIWTIPTLTIVAIASRAFAAYYSVQCVTALRTTSSPWKTAGYGLLAALLLATTLFAKPAG